MKVSIAILETLSNFSNSFVKISFVFFSCAINLMDFISEMEQAFGREAKKIFLPMQAGDVYQTNADCSRLEDEMDYRPKVRLHEGIEKFMTWYKKFYSVNS